MTIGIHSQNKFMIKQNNSQQQQSNKTYIPNYIDDCDDNLKKTAKF